MFYVDDIDILFADFGSDASLMTEQSGASAIRCVFDSSHLVVAALGNFEGITNSGPAATCKSSDVSDAVRGDMLTINNTEYYITDIQPDGTGITVLFLSRDMAAI